MMAKRHEHLEPFSISRYVIKGVVSFSFLMGLFLGVAELNSLAAKTKAWFLDNGLALPAYLVAHFAFLLGYEVINRYLRGELEALRSEPLRQRQRLNQTRETKRGGAVIRHRGSRKARD
jgi:hypothetical protein